MCISTLTGKDEQSEPHKLQPTSTTPHQSVCKGEAPECYFSLVFNFVFLSEQIPWVTEDDGGAAVPGLEGFRSGEALGCLALTCMVASLADRTQRSLSKSWSRSLTARRSCRSSLSFSSRAKNFSSMTRCKERKVPKSRRVHQAITFIHLDPKCENWKLKPQSDHSDTTAARTNGSGVGTGRIPLEQPLGLVFVAAISQETPRLCREFCLRCLDIVGAPEVPNETEVLSFIPLPLS